MISKTVDSFSSLFLFSLQAIKTRLLLQAVERETNETTEKTAGPMVPADD
jgi:hypothetical protein